MNTNENALVPLTPSIKEAWQSVFTPRYRPNRTIAWKLFDPDWLRNIDYILPTRPTIRNAVYNDNQKTATYTVADGLSQLLLKTCYEEAIRYSLGDDEPDEGSDNTESGEDDFQEDLLENISKFRLPTAIGREDVINTLLQWLTEPDVNQIAVTGLGGMGKTTLVLAVALRCLEVMQEHEASAQPDKTSSIPQFEAIIFASARQRYLEDANIGRAFQRDRTLSDLIRTIAETLNCEDLLNQPLENQRSAIIKKLSEQPTLLILDDIEAFDDPDIVLSFLNDRLRGVPKTVKTLVTSRGHIPLQKHFRLQPLAEETTLELIQHQVQQKNLPLSDEACSALAKQGCNIPGVILYAIGQIASGFSLDTVLNTLKSAEGELAAHLFEKSIAPLRTQPVHKLLMALAFFPQPATEAALAAVAFEDINPMAVERGLGQLQKLSLIERSKTPSDASSEVRYSMLPLTRHYVSAELQTHADFAANARDRWVNYYCTWTAAVVPEKDWRRWNHSEALVQDWGNVHEVIEWCVQCDRYEAFWATWRSIRGYAHFAGFWTERLRWLDWFIPIARQRQDLPQLAEALYDKGRTFILRNTPEQLQQAKDLFQKAWDLCSQNHPTFQGEVNIDMAALSIYQTDFETAWEWLDRTEQWIKRFESELDEPICVRLKAQVAYYSGEAYLKTEQYDKAQQQYEKAIKLADEIGWQRAVVYSQVWLADVAMAQHAFEQAETLLVKALPMLEEYQDQRCLALCFKSYALLEKARDNYLGFHIWAILALEGFRKLGMEQEVLEIERLVAGTNPDVNAQT